MAKTAMQERGDSSYRIGFIIVVFLSTSCVRSATLPTLQVSDYSGSIVGWGIQGEVKEAKTWIDSGDSSVLIVSEIQKGVPNEKGYLSEVFGYRFTNQGGKWVLGWSIKEANQFPNEIVHYHKESIQVNDVDGTGGAETLFFYSVAMDGGTEPLVLKMIFHWNGLKAPIRGKLPRELDNEAVYEMTLDPKLKSAPKEIKDYAVRSWKTYVKKKYGELILNP